MYKLRLVSHYFQKQKDGSFVPAFIYIVNGSKEDLAKYSAQKGANARFYGINPETDESYDEKDTHFVEATHPDYGKPLYFTTQATSTDQEEIVDCTMSIKGDNVFFNPIVTTQDLLNTIHQEKELIRKLKAAKKAGIPLI